MKLVLVADCHIDHNQHGLWAVEPWMEACEWAASEGCDVFIVAGDLFHTGKPSSEAICCAIEGFKLAASGGAECVLVAGNHEWIGVTRQRTRRSPAGLLDETGFVHAPAEPTALQLECGLWLGAAPWPTPGGDNVTSWPDQVAELAEDADTHDGPRLLVAHAPIAEAQVHPGSEVELRVLTRDWTVPAAELDLGPFDAVRVGHIHRRQDVTERLAYVGSLDRFTFADEGQEKGFSVLEWDDDAEGFTDTLIETDARQFATLAIGDDLDDIPEGALVRVELEPGQSATEVDRDALDDAGLQLVKVIAGTRSDPESARAAEAVASLAEIDPAELLDEWAEREGIAGDDLYDLQDAGQDVLGWT